MTLLTSFTTAWLTLGPASGAWAQASRQEAAKKGHSRPLTLKERLRIKGAQEEPGEGHVLSQDPDSGSTFPWEGSSGGANTGNGNKLTDIPIVGWTARGGLPVNFTLYHNSEGNHNSELGHKWTHSFDIYLVIDSGTGDVTMHWGNDLSYTFVKNIDGSFTAPTGIYDTLALPPKNWSSD